MVTAHTAQQDTGGGPTPTARRPSQRPRVRARLDWSSSRDQLPRPRPRLSRQQGSGSQSRAQRLLQAARSHLPARGLQLHQRLQTGLHRFRLARRQISQALQRVWRSPSFLRLLDKLNSVPPLCRLFLLLLAAAVTSGSRRLIHRLTGLLSQVISQAFILATAPWFICLRVKQSHRRLAGTNIRAHRGFQPA